MEKKFEGAVPRHREWRRIAKRERRRSIRRKAAQERDADDKHLRETLERSAEYSKWIVDQETNEKEREAVEKQEHDERERLWLEEEVRAQEEWRIHQERRVKLRQEQLLQEEIIRKDFEAKQETLRKKKEETKRLHDEEMKKHEDLQNAIDDYIDNGAKTPEALRTVSETQAGKEPCPFFIKTGACRYGDICSRNHRRLALSRVILIPSFYNHFSLEKNSAEYDTDISLEFEGSETREHFREFYDSVVPELESFGRIKTLKCCRNTEIHLRGNLYVEYYTEREAAKALRKLKGRYYAQRQLNCEFVNLTSWRNAVCGMTKCPKGRACNFLHTFRNPNDAYDIKSPPRWVKKNETSDGSCSRRSEQRTKSKWEDWDRTCTDEAKNWRWSESPEPEGESRGKQDRSRWSIDERSNRRHNSRVERKRDCSERSSSRSSRHDHVSQKHKISSRGSKLSEESTNRKRSSSKKREKRSRKRNRNHHETRSDNEITERDSDVRKSKYTKSSENLGEDRQVKRRISKEQSRAEKEEFDENTDANSNNSRTSANKDAEKSKKKETPINRSDRLIEGSKNSRTPPILKTTSSPSENEWDTTDSG